MAKNINTLRGAAVAYLIADEKAGAVVPAYSAGLRSSIADDWAVIFKKPVKSLGVSETAIREAVVTERDLFMSEFLEQYKGSAANPRANARNYWKRIVDASLPKKEKGAGATEARPLDERFREELAKLIKAYYREEDTSADLDEANEHLELAFAKVSGDIVKLKETA